MIAVIQCAASKRSDAGRLVTQDGAPVRFVADPGGAPADDTVIYARPDEATDGGVSWRDVLLDYNKQKPDNPLALLPAWQLYGNRVYARLVEKLGIENVYILSAGWGLISASFLTPDYDITFSFMKPKDRYKRRKKSDSYKDFRMLAENTREPIVFFGGKDYRPLFAALTSSSRAQKTVFYNSKNVPGGGMGAEAFQNEDAYQLAIRVRQRVRRWNTAPELERFSLVPSTRTWYLYARRIDGSVFARFAHGGVGRLGCGAEGRGTRREISRQPRLGPSVDAAAAGTGEIGPRPETKFGARATSEKTTSGIQAAASPTSTPG